MILERHIALTQLEKEELIVMNNNGNKKNIEKFKQKEVKGMTKSQTITEIVEGIEKELKDGN